MFFIIFNNSYYLMRRKKYVSEFFEFKLFKEIINSNVQKQILDKRYFV